jgi:hypothetical protein
MSKRESYRNNSKGSKIVIQTLFKGSQEDNVSSSAESNNKILAGIRW